MFGTSYPPRRFPGGAHRANARRGSVSALNRDFCRHDDNQVALITLQPSKEIILA